MGDGGGVGGGGWVGEGGGAGVGARGGILPEVQLPASPVATGDRVREQWPAAKFIVNDWHASSVAHASQHFSAVLASGCL